MCVFNEQLILSYAEVHNLTNPKIAWSDMKNCKNAYCMHSKDIHFISVNSTKYSVSVLHLSFKLTDCIFVTWNQCGSGKSIFEKYISYFPFYFFFYFQFKMLNNLNPREFISGFIIIGNVLSIL
jgi:hypothetical protein